MYYFCNFLGRESKGYNKNGVGFVNVSEALDSHVQPAECYLVKENGVTGLNFVAFNERSKGNKVDFIGSLSSDKVGSTDKELVSTDENPIIIIGTRSFKVYNGIPTYIKYIPVQNGVVVALIKGYISVEGKDGEMIPLSRNCDAVSTSEGKVYNAEEIRKLNILKEKESDLAYSEYVVSDCILSLTVSKDGSKLSSIRFNKDNFVILNKEVFIEAKKKKDAELLALAEERKRRAEEIARINESYKQRMLEEERKKAEKKSAKSTRTRKSIKSEDKVEVLSGSSGAQSFLNCIAQLQNEG